jgi:hypothetical protein
MCSLTVIQFLLPPLYAEFGQIRCTKSTIPSDPYYLSLICCTKSATIGVGGTEGVLEFSILKSFLVKLGAQTFSD